MKKVFNIILIVGAILLLGPTIFELAKMLIRTKDLFACLLSGGLFLLLLGYVGREFFRAKENRQSDIDKFIDNH